MDRFQETSAIVTGGASGIGFALASEWATRGASVILADIDSIRVAQAAQKLKETGAHVTTAEIDVRISSDLTELVNQVVEEHGRLDFLFNNAGIGVGGDLRDISMAHWERVIDVNLRGVVNGVMAAYPAMAEQGGGHIVNTASMDGLVPHGFLTPYATTKFGIVGLSLSLRAEAAAIGVRVSVVCPGPVDTPLLDSRGPEDLPIPKSAPDDPRRAITRTMRPCSPKYAARGILRGVSRNRAVIIVPWWANIGWVLMRISPSLMVRLSQADVAKSRRP